MWLVLALDMSQSFWGLIWCTFSKMGRNSKMVNRKVKLAKIWVSLTYEVLALVHLTSNLSRLFWGSQTFETANRRGKTMKNKHKGCMCNAQEHF